MTDRLPFLYPEIALFITTCAVMVLGLSRTFAVRKATAWVTGLGLLVSLVLAARTPAGDTVTATMGQLLLPNLPGFAKCLIAGVALLMLPVLAGTVDRDQEEAIAAGKAKFDALKSNRAEFYAFFLFSITGLMLCAGADTLIWLFLALELTSLPTYIMVTISSKSNKAREAGVKYFFLGALGAAIFLYGFAMIYGGTGSTNFNQIAESIRESGLNSLTMAGILLSIIGICFKIAAVPMHFYAPDVYQGAAAPVSAFLAFTPKTAGFLAIMFLTAMVGWTEARGPDSESLPQALRLTLWVIAALTMTVGNVLAVMQTSVKRILAYSSIAHSGYMLVGIIAGPGDGSFTESGLSAVLFYLLAYGVMNLGTFAVIAVLERAPGKDGEPREIDTVDDLRGLYKDHPVLAAIMAICSLSLLGLPPLLGFFGKMPLFTSAISAHEYLLVVVLGLNSAIGAYYYLRLTAAAFLDDKEGLPEKLTVNPFRGRMIGAGLSAAGAILLAVLGNQLMTHATDAAKYRPYGQQQADVPGPQDGPTQSAQR
jgi:NADH-quinone oxidoreductase subunit N